MSYSGPARDFASGKSYERGPKIFANMNVLSKNHTIAGIGNDKRLKYFSFQYITKTSKVL